MLKGAFGSNHIGAVRVAKVKRYYYDTGLGIPLADIVDANGRQFNGCRVITASGGTPDSFEQVPPPVWETGQSVQDIGDVLIATGDGASPRAYILGTSYVPNLSQELTTEATDTGDTVDYHDKSSIKDRVTKHAGIRVLFASSGTWLLDLTDTERPARIQLDKNSFVRISQDGSAEEFVLLGTKTLEHLRGVHGRLDELATAIDTLGTNLQLVTTTLETIETALGTLGATLVPPVSLYTHTAVADPWDFSKTATLDTATDGGSDSLKAGCFRISKTAKTDQG